MALYRSFEELDLWKKSRLFRKNVALLVKNFPSHEKYRLTDQVIRSSRSITANIAEGHGRFHYQENIQFCRIARGSITETLDHLTVAFDEGYLEEQQFEQLRKQCEELLKLANGYIAYLSRKKVRN